MVQQKKKMMISIEGRTSNAAVTEIILCLYSLLWICHITLLYIHFCRRTHTLFILHLILKTLVVCCCPLLVENMTRRSRNLVYARWEVGWGVCVNIILFGFVTAPSAAWRGKYTTLNIAQQSANCNIILTGEMTTRLQTMAATQRCSGWHCHLPSRTFWVLNCQL